MARGRDKTRRFTGQIRVVVGGNIPGLFLPETVDGLGWWNRSFEKEDECQVRAERIWSELLTRHSDEEGQPEQRIVFVNLGRFFIHLPCFVLDLPWKNASNEL